MPVLVDTGATFVSLNAVDAGRIVTARVGDRGQLGQTLLGMSFLSRLSGVRIDHGRLILTR